MLLSSDPVMLNHHIDAFRLAMRQTAQTVTIITIGGDAGDWGGMTASSMISVSMQPPVILFCVNKTTSLSPRLTVDQPICLNILADHQAGLSAIFAGAAEAEQRFKHGEWLVDGDSTPFLVDAAAHIFAKIEQVIDAGTHQIILSGVSGALTDPTRKPLLYHDGAYHVLGLKTDNS